VVVAETIITAIIVVVDNSKKDTNQVF